MSVEAHLNRLQRVPSLSAQRPILVLLLVLVLVLQLELVMVMVLVLVLVLVHCLVDGKRDQHLSCALTYSSLQ